MNDTDPLDDLTNLRFTRELRAAARQVELTPGSELAVVASGRRKRHRRRQATALMVVVAVGGGTALVVQQLARTGESSIATDDPTTTEGPVSTDPSTTATSVPVATTSPATVAPDAQGAVGAEPAQLVDSNIVWTVVEPDSTQAVAYSEYGADLPGVVLGTAPGRSDEYVPQFWRTDDGVTWSSVDAELPFGSNYSARFADGAVYTVGTAPGIAKASPNPLLVATSLDDGATWDQLELPVDTNADRNLPFMEGATQYASVYPYAGGLVVLVNAAANLDMAQVADAAGVPATDGGLEPTLDGLYVLSDPSCVPEWEETYSMGTVPPQASPLTIAPGSPPEDFGGCERTMIGWSEVGVPQETVDAVFGRTARAFRVVDGVATEFETPSQPFAANGGTPGSPLFSDAHAGWYELNDDGEFVPSTTMGSDPTGWPLGANSTSTFVQTTASSGSLAIVSQVVIGASQGGGAWQYADWSALHGPDRIAMTMSASVTEAGVVQIDRVSPDPILQQGGVSISSGGFTMSRDSAKGEVRVVDDSTGEQLAVNQIRAGDGSLVLVDADGNDVARLNEQAFTPVLYPDWSASTEGAELTLSTSSDGVHVAVESLAGLLGVADAEISSVPRISAVGNTTVVAVTLKERNADGVPRQLVLVGTPRN